MSPSAGALAIIMLATAGVSQATACTTPVYCYDGNAYTDDSYGTVKRTSSRARITCIAECDGNCCTGADNVCDGGRFAVCADEDDGSCDGFNACYGVGGDGGEVGLISGGSCRGYQACYAAGYISGKIGSISGGSCVGESACYYVGGDGGAVGDIIGSCVGDQACDYVGYKNSQFGLSLDSCCNGKNECIKVGCNSTDANALGAILCPSPTPILPESCSKSPSPTAVPTAPTTPGKCKKKASEVEYKYWKGGKKNRGTCGSLEKKKEKKRKNICKKKKKKKNSPLKKCPCVCNPFLE